MANYPTLPQSTGSREEWIDPAIVEYSRAGGAKIRRLQGAKKRAFIVEHRFLTNTQKTTLETFYDTNRAISLTFAWADAPGTTYTVVFADQGELAFSREPGNYWNVTVRLAEV